MESSKGVSNGGASSQVSAPKTLPKYPIKGRDSALSGTIVSFVNGASKVTAPDNFFENHWGHLFWINSMDQLNTVKEKISGFSANYNSSFFDSKALIVVPIDGFSSASIKFEKASLIKSNGELCIEITLRGPKDGVYNLMRTKPWILAFEVNKSELSDVNKFSCYQQWGEPY